MKANEIRHYLNSVFWAALSVLGWSIREDNSSTVRRANCLTRSAREHAAVQFFHLALLNPSTIARRHGRGWCACKGPPNDSAVRRATVLAGMTREKLQTVIFRIFDSGLSCHEVRQLAQSTSSS
jgi:hypothetical protein